jgi:hypothetical protein
MKINSATLSNSLSDKDKSGPMTPVEEHYAKARPARLKVNTYENRRRAAAGRKNSRFPGSGTVRL